MKELTHIKKFNEMRKWNPETKKIDVVENPLGTVGQLIKYLEQFNPDTKVAINVAEEPSEIFEIVETTAERCAGRGDGLVITADWAPEEKVILIKGNQY
jgi:hypothetical protein